jgi:hypothetical protein
MTAPGPAAEPQRAQWGPADAPGTTPAAGSQDQPAATAPDAAAEPARAAALTNSDVAAAWQHMAASSSGHLWPVAAFITHGTVPDPGALHGPDDPQDSTAWDGDGLRRSVASEPPSREGTLNWGQAARWIDAGMTSGDLQILLEASRLAAFCDSWLEQVRDTAHEAEADAFYDAGHGAAVALQECISRVTAAAAQAHGPDAAVPAAPAGADSYRREQVVTTPGQDQALATIRELREFAQQAARRINDSSGPGPAATPAEAGVPAAPETAGPGALAPADGHDTGRSGDPAPVPEPVSDDLIRAAFDTFRSTAAAEGLPAGDKDQALAHAFSLAMRRDEATHQHPAGANLGDQYEVTYRGPFGTTTTLPACCEQSARQSAQAMSGMMAEPVSAVTITGEDGRRETVFRGGQPVPPAAAPPPAAAAGESQAPADGRAHEIIRTATGPQPGPGAHQTVCTVCSDPLDPALHSLGDLTHPTCDPAQQVGQPALAAAQPTLALDDPAATASGTPGQEQPPAAGAELSGAGRRGRDELHAAVDFLAALPGTVATDDSSGFATARTYLGMFLADLPAGQWTGEMAIAAWAMLGRYTEQLGEAGISYERLPCPPGAEHMNGAQLATAHETAAQQMAAIWPGMLRSRYGSQYIRCDSHGATVMLGYDIAAGADLAHEAAQIPGLHGYATAAQAGVYAFTSLPDVVALADRHGIPVTDDVRALAAAATRQDSRTSITAGPEPASVPGAAGAADPDQSAPEQQPPEPAATAARPGPQPVTGSDLALALRRMAPQHFAALIENGRDPARYQFDGWRHDGEPDPGASELVEFGRAGLRIRIGAPDGARDRTLTWAQVRHWIRPGLTPARQQLLATAARAFFQYSILVSSYAMPATPAHEALQQAARELDGIQQRALGAIISDALARRGTGPLPDRLAGPATLPGDRDEVLPLPGDGDRAAADAADLNRVGELAGVLPAWPPRWSKPVSQVQPGDILRGPPHAPALFIVTDLPRRTGTATEFTGTAGGPDGPATTRLISHGHDPDPQVEVIPASGPLTGPIPAPAMAIAPAYDAESSLELPVPDHRDDLAAGLGQPQSGPAQGPPRPAPEGISPLRGAAAASHGRWRPHRLVYPDGAALTCRPDGRFGPAWAGTAAGIIPAADHAGGWLQAVVRSDGSLHVVHPAVIAPAGINPYALMRYRDQQRFSEFDQAEAAGHDAAWMDAVLVDAGDLVRIQIEPGGDPEIRAVTSAQAAGIRVRVTTTGPGGDTRTHPYLSRDRVEVMLPARHPAEDGPYAAQLFAPRPHQALPGPAAGSGPAAARPTTASLAAGLGGVRFAELEQRVAALERELAHLRSTGTAGPGSDGDGPARSADGHVWAPAAASAEWLRQAQASAGHAIAALRQEWLWTQLHDLTDSACRLTRDALTGRLRFADLPQALRSWRGLWAQVCELTGDLADVVMARLRPGSRSWRAARRLRQAATEAVAHARGWLSRGENLPPGSYDPPPGYRAPTWARADAAARLHRAGAGPLSQIDFPGALAGATARKTPGPHTRRRGARTAAARTAQRAAQPAGRP